MWNEIRLLQKIAALASGSMVMYWFNQMINNEEKVSEMLNQNLCLTARGYCKNASSHRVRYIIDRGNCSGSAVNTPRARGTLEVLFLSTTTIVSGNVLEP